MHAEPVMSEQGEDTQTQQPEAETAGHEAAGRVIGSLLDVLMPATPPEPKNARIVRQFDLEAAKTDPRPVTLAAVPEKRAPQPEHRTREEAKAYRNRSLRAAAGFAD